MRVQITDTEINEVNGGSVVLSEPCGLCGFSSTGKIYKIKGPFRDMRNLMLDLYDENVGKMTDAEFDALVLKEYQERGWL